MDAITTKIGGRELKLRLTGRGLRRARAEGIDVMDGVSKFQGGEIDLLFLPELIYAAALHDQPDITLDEVDGLVDFREIESVVGVFEQLLPTDPAGKAKPQPVTKKRSR